MDVVGDGPGDAVIERSFRGRGVIIDQPEGAGMGSLLSEQTDVFELVHVPGHLVGFKGPGGVSLCY